jgi:hypothetical protein
VLSLGLPSRATSALAPPDHITLIEAGATMSPLMPVITKCHSLLSQLWLVSAFAVMVMVPPLLPPPVAVAGLAVNISRASPTTKDRTPVALRIRRLPVLMHGPMRGLLQRN